MPGVPPIDNMFSSDEYYGMISTGAWRQRQMDIQHLKDSAKGLFSGTPPRRYWGIYAASNHKDASGKSRWWCIYPAADDQREYSLGLWFRDETIAKQVHGWKVEREKYRPWPITRMAVRLWRALPWR